MKHVQRVWKEQFVGKVLEGPSEKGQEDTDGRRQDRDEVALMMKLRRFWKDKPWQFDEALIRFPSHWDELTRQLVGEK